MAVLKSMTPSVFIILIGIIIAYGYLRMNGNNSDFVTMFQIIFGGKPLYGVKLKALFIMVIAWLQYINIHYISFYIDNSDSLSVRYGSKDNWLKALIKGIFIITAVFVMMFYTVWLLLDFCFGASTMVQVFNMHALVVIGRIYLFCIILILIFVCLLLKLTKTSTYMIMGGIAIFLAMTSHHRGGLIFILPQFSNPTSTLLNVILNILFAFKLVVLITRINRKKELSSYED
ncbi:hypothetical protein [Paenibacillus sp. YYML68]|uniref:hypothetical protein n=1 Tax=Paenibacillus sp. YYML68 TaxID=2909250 RepID=UPI002491FD34|nr:hypothetical protein [Paenibacillus sp. YYML68]